MFRFTIDYGLFYLPVCVCGGGGGVLVGGVF